jgi:hypothetical protein
MALVSKLRTGHHKNELSYSGRVERSAAIYFQISEIFPKVTPAEPHKVRQKELSDFNRDLELSKNKAEPLFLNTSNSGIFWTTL